MPSQALVAKAAALDARRGFVAALLGSDYNASCASTEIRSKEGSYFVCDVLSRDRVENERLGCRVISVGIGNIWSLEDELARAGCVVDAYDPTVELRARHVEHAQKHEKTHFHFAGLGASLATNTTNSKAKVMQKVHLSGYGTLNVSTYLPLDRMLRRGRHNATAELFRHHNATAAPRLDLLKIDCEGCEWDVFEDLAARAPHALASVQQVIIELHMRGGKTGPRIDEVTSFRGTSREVLSELTAERAVSDWRIETGFGLHTPQQFDTLMRHLLVDHGFRVARTRLHPGKGHILSWTFPPPGLREAGFPTRTVCCVELTLIRPVR